MDKRKKIAVNFFYNYKYATGLTIYIINIIRALKMLDDKQKPELVIFHNSSSPIADIQKLDYPYISFFLYQKERLQLGIAKRVVNKIARTLGAKNIFKTEAFSKNFPADVDLIYPYSNQPETAYVREKVYWKADFQEKYYPEFFKNDDLEWSANFLNKVSKGNDVLVLSSHDAFNDYKKFYPDQKNPVKLLRFASQLPPFNHIDIDAVKLKYDINNKYFLVANQFWPHKNHLTILKAINRVKDSLNSCFVFTGTTSSYRDAEYFPSLMRFIKENGLNDLIKFTGFIDRDEQLQLMNNAIAIIQPSLFEGWSTVIEDCKALNQFVIASDLRVNLEQIQTNAAFFSTMDDEELSRLILKAQNEDLEKTIIDYSITIEGFKKDVVNIFNI